MPTLDQRGRQVNVLDGDNQPIQGQVVQGLNVNYHSTQVPTPQELFKLHTCLELTRRLASHATQVTRRMGDAMGANLVTRAFSGQPVSEVEAEILKYHFRLPELGPFDPWADWKPYLDRIHQVYDRVSTYLGGPLTISDAHSGVLSKKENRDGRGYVAPKSSTPGRDQLGTQPVVIFQGKHKFEDGWKGHVVSQCLYEARHQGSIHIKFTILQDQHSQINPNLFIARSLMHEATHKVCDTYDYAYASDEVKYAAMPGYEAIDNADSYAWAALSLFKNKLIRNAMKGLKLLKAGQLSLMA